MLRIHNDLRTWQETYNPVLSPTKWSDLRETTILNRYAREALVERGAETFLFRDPCSKYPDQPLTHHRLVVFWNKLCAELEDRLALEGDTAPGGERIQLVLRDKKGGISGTVYNLHALRVTMITAWAEIGVPIDVLMKVAGHATAIMAIYYQKQSISHVTDILNSATERMMFGEQEDWQAWLKTKSYDDLPSLVAYNDLIALASISEGVSASLGRRDHGICPVGCGRCHEGGGLIEGGPSNKYYPVPGGPQNCVRCRFFITGPCFLIGLQSHFNDVGFRYREASKAYVSATTEFEKLDHERKRSLATGTPFFHFAKLNTLSATLDQRTREVDELALSWHATFNLIQQCIALLKSPPKVEADGRTIMIVNGSFQDLEYALELDETGDRDFELLDRICQSSVFFKSVDARVPNLHRMRHFDQLLQRNGYEPMFFQLSEEEALAAGNELARFLYTHFGDRDVNALMSGAQTLRSLGIEAERSFTEHLSKICGRKISLRLPNKRIDI